MKKIISFILIVFCLTGCAKIEKNITPTPTELLSEDDIIITVPGSFFEFREVKSFLDAEISRGNIKSINENPDGSITYTLNKKQYETVLSNLKSSIIETFEILENNNGSIKKIEHNEELTEITFIVVKDDYENSADEIAAYIASGESMVYSFLKSNNITFPAIKIHVKDEETGEIIRSIRYPYETR